MISKNCDFKFRRSMEDEFYWSLQTMSNFKVQDTSIHYQTSILKANVKKKLRRSLT